MATETREVDPLGWWHPSVESGRIHKHTGPQGAAPDRAEHSMCREVFVAAAVPRETPQVGTHPWQEMGGKPTFGGDAIACGVCFSLVSFTVLAMRGHEAWHHGDSSGGTVEAPGRLMAEARRRRVRPAKRGIHSYTDGSIGRCPSAYCAVGVVRYINTDDTRVACDTCDWTGFDEDVLGPVSS